jgi:hypothetical protein
MGKKTVKDWCSLSPDGFLGVEWALSCMAHDHRYERNGSLIEKFKADYYLAADVWHSASMADKTWKRGAVRCYSVAMYAGVSTLGMLFWYRAKAIGAEI